MKPDLTVVVPVWRDDEALAGLLDHLDQLSLQWPLRVIVVDGAATASTAALVDSSACYLATQPSRGGQIASGLAHVESSWVWVLHADCRPDASAVEYLQALCARGEPCWGRFDVSLPGLGWVAFFMNWRSRLTKICTGDQGMFFHNQLLRDIGGFPRQPLMEDVEVSKRLKRIAPAGFRAPRIRVESSPRRWRSHGVLRTVVSMWWFRLRYFFGARADDLVAQYYGRRD